MYRLTKEETETVISFNDKEAMASIYTCNKALVRKLDKFCEDYQCATVEQQNKYAKTYLMPKSWIKIHKPRLYSDKVKQKLRENAKANLIKKVAPAKK